MVAGDPVTCDISFHTPDGKPLTCDISLHFTFPGALCACVLALLTVPHTSPQHPLPISLDPRAFPTTWSINLGNLFVVHH